MSRGLTCRDCLFVGETILWGPVNGLDFEQLMTEEGLSDMSTSRLGVPFQEVPGLSLLKIDSRHLVGLFTPVIKS